MFPFFFSFLPDVNTKMMIALCGLILFFFKLSATPFEKNSTQLISMTLWAMGVSLASLTSMVINNTPDDSYLTYFISMWVWLGGAYFIVNSIRYVHGIASIELVSLYMIGTGVLQCVLAILIDQYAWFDNLVSTYCIGEGYMMGKEGRMHGIGCALDVGGGRFAVLIFINMFLLIKYIIANKSNISIFFLLISLFLMTTVGNMIGRTASIGIILGIAYWLYALIQKSSFQTNIWRKKFIRYIVSFFIVSFLFGALLYNTNPHWEKQLRFGFEGFFSLAETGEWKVTSNDMLQEGYKFPDNLHTWIIGDGYMAGVANDPYYVGEETDYGFYKNTDAGYSRFIFYFGLIGLSIFSAFFINNYLICSNRHPQYKILFLGILILNFTIWIKVATDIFVMFAPFLCITRTDEQNCESTFNTSLNPIS